MPQTILCLFNALQSSLQSTSLSRHSSRCSQLVFGQLCSMAVRPGPQMPSIYNGFAEMTVPWSGGSAVQSWKMRFPRRVLHQKLDVDDITAVLRTRRLRWYGHVQRATSCINSITRLGVPGTRNRGRPRKTWCEKWYDYMQPGWCQPVRQEFMENECEALPGVAYPGVRDNRSTINTKTGYDNDDHYLWRDGTGWVDLGAWFCAEVVYLSYSSHPSRH